MSMSPLKVLDEPVAPEEGNIEEESDEVETTDPMGW